MYLFYREEMLSMDVRKFVNVSCVVFIFSNNLIKALSKRHSLRYDIID